MEDRINSSPSATFWTAPEMLKSGSLPVSCSRLKLQQHWKSTADGARLKSCVKASSCMIGYFVDGFYRAMLCIRGTSHGPVSVPVSVCLSVCPSVISRSSTKTAKRRITQTTPHDSPGTLVFWSQRSRQNPTGVTPYRGAKCRWGGSKSATFDK